MLNISLNGLEDIKIGANEYVIAPIYARPLAQLFQNDESLRRALGQITLQNGVVSNTGFFGDVLELGTWDGINDITYDMIDNVMRIWINPIELAKGIDQWNFENPNTQINPINWNPFLNSLDANSDVTMALGDNGSTLDLSLRQASTIYSQKIKISATDPKSDFLFKKIYPIEKIGLDGKSEDVTDDSILLFPQVIYADNKPKIYFGLSRLVAPELDYKCRVLSVVDTTDSGLEVEAGVESYDLLFSPYTSTQYQWTYPLKYLDESIASMVYSESSMKNLVTIQHSSIPFVDYLPETGRTLPAPAPANSKPGPKQTMNFWLNTKEINAIPMVKYLVDILKPTQTLSGIRVYSKPIYFNGDRKYQIYVKRDEYAGTSKTPYEYQYEILKTMGANTSASSSNASMMKVEAIGIRNMSLAFSTGTLFICPQTNSNIDNSKTIAQSNMSTLISIKIVAIERDGLKMKLQNKAYPLFDINSSTEMQEIKSGTEIEIARRYDGSIIMLSIDGRQFQGGVLINGVEDWSYKFKDIEALFFDEDGDNVVFPQMLISSVTTHYKGI